MPAVDQGIGGHAADAEPAFQERNTGAMSQAAAAAATPLVPAPAHQHVANAAHRDGLCGDADLLVGNDRLRRGRARCTRDWSPPGGGQNRQPAARGQQNPRRDFVESGREESEGSLRAMGSPRRVAENGMTALYPAPCEKVPPRAGNAEILAKLKL